MGETIEKIKDFGRGFLYSFAVPTLFRKNFETIESKLEENIKVTHLTTFSFGFYFGIVFAATSIASNILFKDLQPPYSTPAGIYITINSLSFLYEASRFIYKKLKEK